MGKPVLPWLRSKYEGVNYDFHCYCLHYCRITVLYRRRNRRMEDMVRYPRLAFSCWHLSLCYRRNFAYNLASGELCLTVPPHGRDTPFFCQWVALSFGRLIGDAMSRISFFCILTVKFFTSNLYKFAPYNLLKFVQSATCIFLCYLIYFYQEVRVRPHRKTRERN